MQFSIEAIEPKQLKLVAKRYTLGQAAGDDVRLAA